MAAPIELEGYNKKSAIVRIHEDNVLVQLLSELLWTDEELAEEEMCACFLIIAILVKCVGTEILPEDTAEIPPPFPVW